MPRSLAFQVGCPFTLRLIRLHPDDIASDPDLQHLEAGTYLYQLPKEDHSLACRQRAHPKATPSSTAPSSATGGHGLPLTRHEVTEEMVDRMLQFALPYFSHGKVKIRAVYDSVKSSHPHGMVLEALGYKPCNLARRLRSVTLVRVDALVALMSCGVVVTWVAI